jgi:hypothetical protein
MSKTPSFYSNTFDGTQEEDRPVEFKLTGHYRPAGIDQANSANIPPVEELEK